LELAQCKFKSNEKGHCKYIRSDLNRPIVFQNHIDPVPEFIVRNVLRLFPYSKDDFFDIMEEKKFVNKQDAKYYTLDDFKL
jgi:hypothetical protein